MREKRGQATSRAGGRPAKRARPAQSSRPPVSRAPLSPRALAIIVLARVRATDAFLNVVLDTVLDEHRPDERDAGLVTELVYGSTRRQLQLDEALLAHLDRKLDAIEDRVLAALRIGAYQRFFLRVPPHAAVAATVEAVKELGLQRAAGFVNAVLRKLGDEPPQGHSHPHWLVERWSRHFGPERTQAMLEADNVPPPVVARVNPAKTTRDELLNELPGAKPTAVSPLGLVLPPGQPDELFGYAEGLWQVQDEAAQLVGLYAAVPKGARVLDACAAPGGKSCHLAADHEVVALDVHANKLDKIRHEAARLGLTLDVRRGDASKLPESLGEFDAVLLDAPCSGLGTLRRHPELRYRRLPEDLPRLAALQRSLLESCQQRVKPGGLLVYAVCTTEPEEGADQIELFLRSHPDFTAEPPPPGPVPFPTWQGYLRTLPGPEGMDGFFAARLRRMY